MTNSSIKISVIIPAHNAAAYIEKCLKSLQTQTLEDLEIIIVDDKSSDETFKIVERAASEDSRIRIIRNSIINGAGPSRNKGMEIARGEYLSFIDSDDYVADDFYEKLYKMAKENDADIVKAHVTAVDLDGNPNENWPNISKSLDKFFRNERALYRAYTSEHFSAIYKRAFIMSDQEIKYGDTKIGEDSVFILKACLNNPIFFACDDTEYYHLIRKDSLFNTISFESCLDGLKALEKRIEILKDNGYPEQYIEYLRPIVRMYINRFKKCDEFTKTSFNRNARRRDFQKKLDEVLSGLPDSTAITDAVKEYETLEKMVEEDERNLEKEYLEIIREVQLEELELLKLLKYICNKYDIKYSLHGGTLLGAVRHGGFIPWDDDLDVIMDRSEYNRFIEAWNAENPEGYYLQTKEKEESYTRNFLKIRKDGTVFLQKDDTPGKMHTGVFIDVEPVDRIPNKKMKRALYLWNCFKYEIYSREYVPGGSLLMRIVGSALLNLTTHKGRMNSIRKIKKKITSYNDNPNLERIIVANFATMKRPLPADIMDKYTTLKFENEEYMVISEWEKLLEKWYGDYMELPPEKMRKPNHIPLEIDLNDDL